MYSYLFLEEDSELEASMPETEEFLAHHFPRLVAVFWTVRDSEGLPQVIHLFQKVSLSTLSSILRGAGSIHFSSYQSRGVIEGTGSHASLIRPDIDLWLAHGYSEMFDIPEPTPHNFRPIVGRVTVYLDIDVTRSARMITDFCQPLRYYYTSAVNRSVTLYLFNAGETIVRAFLRQVSISAKA
jgi:hypothetical protein